MSTPSPIANRLTRLGFHCLFLGSFAAFGGAVRGFNLLLVLAAVLVGAMLIQWRWSRTNIAAVTVKRRLPTEAFVGQLVRVQFRLTNRSRFLPKWMLRVEDVIRSGSGNEWESAGCGVALIDAASTRLAEYQCRFLRRGHYRFGPIQLVSSFPFALLQSRRTIVHSSEMWVLPQLLELQEDWREQCFADEDESAALMSRAPSNEGEFFGLRRWRHGDNRRWIHWRTSARVNEPVVRQFEQSRPRKLCLLVDAHAPDSAGQAVAERVISLAATMITNLTVNAANPIALGTSSAHESRIVQGHADFDRRNMLIHLAEIDTEQPTDVANAIERLSRQAGSMIELVVISSRSEADAGWFAPGNSTGDRRTGTPPLPIPHWIDIRERGATLIAETGIDGDEVTGRFTRGTS